jgi:hypothetical protein
MSYQIEFAQYLRRNKETDVYDIEEAVARFTTEATTYAELHEKTSDKIKTAIEKQYVGHEDKSLNTEAMITLALAEIGYTLDSYQPLKARAMEIIQDPKSRYYVRRGRENSGRARMNDAQYAVFLDSGKNPSDLEQEAKEAKKTK